MAGARSDGLRSEHELTVERAFENRFHALIGEGLELNGPLAGSFQSLLAIDLLQAEDPQSGAVAHFRMRFAL